MHFVAYILFLFFTTYVLTYHVLAIELVDCVCCIKFADPDLDDSIEDEDEDAVSLLHGEVTSLTGG